MAPNTVTETRKSKPLKVAVVGPGGVGGLFGARLVQAGHNVHFLGRSGPHLESIQRNGLRILSPDEETTVRVDATHDPKAIGPCDFVLLCVKSTMTREVTSAIHPLLKEDTAVVTFQNGVDNEEIISAQIGRDRTMGGVAYVFSTIDQPGAVRHAGGVARLVFGELDGSESARAVQLLELFTSASIDTVLSRDINRVLWHKYALICAVAGMTAATRLPIGVIRPSNSAMTMLVDILAEVVEVAESIGIHLGQETIDEHRRFVESLPATAYSSLHYDLVQGKPMELESLHGTLLRLADTAGVPTPMCKAIYAILSPFDQPNGTVPNG